MKKEKLKNKLKISDNTCIHCPTLELAIQVLSIFHQSGLRWNNETSYVLEHNRYAFHNWYDFKENTLYFPFEGGLSALGFANLTGYKVISAEEFIALHPEGEEFDFDNYTPKGDLIGFPKEIIACMLNYQVEQGNTKDISVFERQCATGCFNKGFTWDKTKEGNTFWHEVIIHKNFNLFFLFFEKYPKKDNQDNSQEFRVGDKVIYYITNKRGIVEEIIKHKFENKIDIVVNFGINDICEYEISSDIERPFLLHYREDYDYNVIDFNNLPKRQEAKKQKPKKWRAEKQGIYYCVRFDAEGWSFADEIRDIYGYNDNNNYNSGNYFHTKIEAEIIAQKLNEYFKQLIQEEHGQ